MPDPWFEREVTIEKRAFSIRGLRAVNGCLLIISEGRDVRVGSVALSVRVGDRANSTVIIPSKFGDIYSSIFAETVANLINGIVIASLYATTPMDTVVAKKLLDEVRSLCVGELEPHGIPGPKD